MKREPIILHDVPQQAIEAEQAVIGGLMLAPGEYHRVAAVLDESDFYRHDHRLIFRAIANICEDNGQCDVVTVAELLETQALLDTVGGLPYVSAIAENTPGAANILAYAEIVRDRSRRRQIVALLERAKAVTVRQGTDEAISMLTVELDALLTRKQRNEMSWAEVLNASRKRIEAASEARANGGYVGVATGLPKLDRWMGGLHGGILVIVAARPSVGKTAMCQQWLLHAGSRGLAVGVLSLEMQPGELGTRSFANRYGLNVTSLFRGDAAALSELTRMQIERPISNYRVHVDCSTYDLAGIVAQITEWKRRENIAYAIVDHIGLVEGVDESRRDLVLSHITRTLKKTAKRLEMPIVAVSQLNRNVEKERRRPMLSDLRDSGGIEQDADIALFLHSGDEAGEKEMIDVELGLLKNRNGRKGWMTGFRFDGARQKFMQLEEDR